MYWKNLLALFLSALLPAVYTIFISIFKDFPLSQEQWIALWLWIVGMLIGGWNLKSFIIKRNSYIHKR